jgi:hypothetical protein
MDEDPSSSSASMDTSFKRPDFFKQSIGIGCDTGDSVVNDMNIQKVSVIKIDVEGHEYHVLRGFERVVSGHRPYILVEILGALSEVHEVANAKRVKNAQDVEHWSRTHGYSIWELMGNGRPRRVEDLADAARRQRGPNYLLRPEATVPAEEV